MKAFWQGKTRKQKQALIFLMGFVSYGLIFGVVLSITATLLAPGLAKDYLNGAKLEVSSIIINPYAFSLEVNELSLGMEGEAPMVAFERFYSDFELHSLFNWAWTFDDIALEKPTISVAINKQGDLNFLALLSTDVPEQTEKNLDSEEEEETTEGGSIPPVIIELLAVTELTVHFFDESKEETFSTTLDSLSLSLPNFSTRPDEDTPYELYASSRSGIIGKELYWSGTVSVLPQGSQGVIEISDISLVEWWRYIKDDVNFTLEDGALSVKLHYAADFSNDEPAIHLSDGEVTLQRITIPDGERDAVNLTEFSVSGISLDLAEKDIKVDRVALIDSEVNARIDATGVLNFESLFVMPSQGDEPQVETVNQEAESQGEAKTADTNAGEEAESEEQFAVHVDQIEILNTVLGFTDEQLETIETINLAVKTLAVSSFNLLPDNQSDFAFYMTLDKGGEINAKGQFGISPLMVDAAFNLKTLPLSYANPQLEALSNLAIDQGSLDIDATFNLDEAGYALTANTAINDLDVNLSSADLLAFQRFEINALSFSSVDNALLIDSVNLTSPDIHVLKQADGTMNLDAIMKDQGNEAEASEPADQEAEITSAEPGASSKPLLIELGTFTLGDLAFHFSDLSMQKGFNLSLESFSGTASQLSSNPEKNASVAFSGLLNGLGKLDLSGDVNVLAEDLFTDVSVSLVNLQLTPFTAFTETYIGREIAQGQLYFDLKYHIESNKLTSDNNILLDQFKLGKKVKSEEAIDLPVGLAISLLKNPQGKIKIDMPINGDLDDPDFRYGKLVWKTVTNLIVKAAASPFTLLAGLVSSSESLDKIAFLPGSAELSEQQHDILKQLQAALLKRPGIAIEVAGCYDDQHDKAVLHLSQVQEKLGLTAETDEQGYLKLLESMIKQQSGQLPVYAQPEGEPAPTLLEKIAYAEAQVMPYITFDDARLDLLAKQRAQTIQNALISGQDESDLSSRIFITSHQTSSGVDEIACKLTVK